MAHQTLDDLRRVIRRIETRRLPRAAPAPVEEVLGGELIDTGEGQLVVVRREFPLSHRHGHQPLAGALSAPLNLLSLLARLEAPLEDVRQLLFLDAETTGLAEHVFEILPDLLRRGLDTLESCACQVGCPSCVGPVNEVGRRAKATARALLRALTD